MFFFRFRLFKYVCDTRFFVLGKYRRSSLAAEITVNAGFIDVVSTLNILLKSFGGISHFLERQRAGGSWNGALPRFESRLAKSEPKRKKTEDGEGIT